MKKREKIILAVMGVVIILGLVNFIFFSGPGKPPTAATGGKNEDTAKFMTEFANNLKKEASAEPDFYIIARAEANWESDPFYKGILTSSKEKTAPGVKGPDIVYSGYIDLGGQKKVAIINGGSYEVGDRLELKGAYYVRQIDPARVVIVDRDSRRSVTIPLKEETF